MRTLIHGLALSVLLLAPSAYAQEGDGAEAATETAAEPAAPASAGDDLSKPFDDYTLNDLFPQTVDDRAAEIGADFEEWGKAHRSAIEARVSAIEGAISVKKSELKTLSAKQKVAKKEKDLETAGSLTGKIAAEGVIVDGLTALAAVTKQQLVMADAWAEYGSAIQKWHAASTKLHSKHGDVKLHRGAGGMDKSAYDDAVAEVEALRALSQSQDDMASALKSVLAARAKFFKALQKGGIVPK